MRGPGKLGNQDRSVCVFPTFSKNVESIFKVHTGLTPGSSPATGRAIALIVRPTAWAIPCALISWPGRADIFIANLWKIVVGRIHRTSPIRASRILLGLAPCQCNHHGHCNKPSEHLSSSDLVCTFIYAIMVCEAHEKEATIQKNRQKVLSVWRRRLRTTRCTSNCSR